ncbi:type II toxin-antitoxin system death-on-curing family toxin [Methylococcus sp. Mc7]|uniref:type II toxin-antitoxin system death-on-curing family toxin n=1 Tax=Methylococcus sp. Mc7 TaxID=2860258 RepID=UPI001C532951|nr:type II toxin-antitoxin system death-on-curing family toxin [Methylococcus sp. Mc7]QXP83887.1 type II toxin-antitoxin system death-on-curing family toxin [Methylococcus sp. Mc7]
MFHWIDEAVVWAVHEAQLAEHGGSAGVRDAGLLDSALTRPRNLAAYGTPDAADCAAAYGFGIARNHPFIDGNKRTAFVCVELFLALNGYSLEAEDADCVLTMLALAAGDLDEVAFAAWIRVDLTKR